MLNESRHHALVVVDSSATASAALDTALAVAGARITCVTLLGVVERPRPSGFEPVAYVRVDLEDQLVKLCLDLTARVPARVGIRHLVVSERLDRAVLKAASEGHYDVVALARPGRESLTGVSRRRRLSLIVKRCPIPVLCAPEAT